MKLGTERLEERTVPYAGIGMPGGLLDRGDNYQASGEKIALLERTSQAVVRVTPEMAADWSASGLDVKSGFRVERSFDSVSFLLTSYSGDDTVNRAAALPGVLWSAPLYQASTSQRYAAELDEVVVALQPGQSAATFFAKDPRFTSYRAMLGTDDQFIATTAGHGAEALQVANDLASDPRVNWASPNLWQDWQKFAVPNDPLYSSEWHLNNTGTSGGVAGADARLVGAWNITTGDPSITVAIDDDGIEYTHPDLLGNVDNHGDIPGDGIDNDGNGYVDDSYGWDWTDNGNAPGPDSSSDEHGTSTTGVAVGVGNNSLGIAGAAYTSKFFASRIFAGASGTSDANIASSLYYAAGRTANGTGTWNAADIISCSWGGGSNSGPINAALTWATTNGRGGLGVPVFIASGNESVTTVSQPAAQAATNAGVIAVGASTNTDVRASYSNYGTGLSLVAPSSGGSLSIQTTDRTGTLGYATTDYTGTSLSTGFGGTSSATPLAAGVGALVLSRALTVEPNLTAAQLKKLLMNTTNLIAGASYSTANGFNSQYGTGRIDATAAVSGVGKAVAQVLSGNAVIANGGSQAFGTVTVGQTATRTFRIRNGGTQALTLSNLTAGGAFSISTGFSAATLNVGDSATFTVLFAPTGNGTASQTLTFTTNDASNPVYTINLAGAGTGGTTGPTYSASGTVYEDRDGNGVKGATEVGVAGTTVYADLNNNSLFDRSSFAAAGLSITIPDNSTAGATSTIAVSGAAGTVNGLTVTLNIAHSYVGDLQLSLISPSGTAIALATNRGGAGVNFTNTTFDDSATTAISATTASNAPFTGSFIPETALSALNGGSINGTWTLKMVDGGAGDIGTLTGWSLTFPNLTSEPSATTDSSGAYSIIGLSAGTVTVREAPTTGYVTASQSSASATITTAAVTGLSLGLVKTAAIYGGAFADSNANGIKDGSESGLAGRTAFLDLNGNGTRDLGSSTSYSSGTLSKAIPDNSTVGVTSAITTSGLTGTVSGVSVTVNVTHIYDGDLKLSLISPAGTTIPLSNGRGGSGDNFTNTVFADSGSTAIATTSASNAPFTGTFRPESPLSALNGQVSNGSWKLLVVDTAAQDTGTLNNWSLTLLTGANEPSATTDANGEFTFSGLTAGNYAVRLVTAAVGERLTTPASGSYASSVGSGALFNRTFAVVSDTVAPTVQAITQLDADPLTGSTARWLVTFTEAVTGITPSNFALAASGLTGASIQSISAPSGSSVTVTANTGTGSGSLGLNLTTAAGILDLANNPLATTTSVGPVYIVNHTTSPNAPTVQVVQVDDGTGQQSRIRSFAISYSSAITYAGQPTAAYVLTKDGSSTTIGFTVSTQTVNGASVATLTLADPSLEYGSLANGHYTLTVLANQVSAGGVFLNANVTANVARYFGDADGNGHVDAQDVTAFLNSYGTSQGNSAYRDYLDSNGDGNVDAQDVTAFLNSYGL